MPKKQQAPTKHRIAAACCAECGASDDCEAIGWRAYRLNCELDIYLYCPGCAEREFGPLRRLSRPLGG